MIKNTILRYFSVMIVSFFVIGCDKTVEIDKATLMQKTQTYKEPKVAIWYYRGSDEEYDYFLYWDLGIKEYYKVKRNEKTITDKIRFTPPASEDYKLIVMPWGTQKDRE